jgi:hypothetical protein
MIAILPLVALWVALWLREFAFAWVAMVWLAAVIGGSIRAEPRAEELLD